VCRDINVFGVKLAQLVDGAEQAVDTWALEWGQHLEGEGCACIVGDRVYSVHISICFLEETKVAFFFVKIA
jgi:hypothetical protein